ncbi:hypothetical protein [Emticicia fontis]
MDNEKNKDRETMFPSPYEHFEALIANDLRMRKELEDELKKIKQNYQPPKSYKLDLRPPGIEDGRQHKNFNSAIAKIENQIKDTENRIVKVIDRECKNLELNKEEINLINNITFEKMFPDPLKGLGPLEKKAYISRPKDIEESQQNMYYLLKNAREHRQYKNSKEDFSPNIE